MEVLYDHILSILYNHGLTNNQIMEAGSTIYLLKILSELLRIRSTYALQIKYQEYMWFENQ